MATENLGEAVLELRTDDSSFSSGIISARKLALGLAGAIAGVATGAVASLALIGTAAVSLSADFESSFAGLRKTVDATEDQFGELADGMRDLSKTIPVNVNELNAIGEAAGQLGIEVENMLAFTETVANIGVATNLTANQAAEAFAQIANVTKLPQTQFENLGSALVELGNNAATNEAKILEFASRIAGAGATVGATTAEIFGISSAFASVGIGAEAGGTAIQKVMLKMLEAVELGTEELEVFARTAGLSADEFVTAFGEDAAGAFADFVSGLGEQGTAAIGTLDELGLSDQRLISAFLRVASAGDLVTESIALSTEAFAENTALAEEAAQRYKTFDSQVILTKNVISDLGLTLGDALLPALADMLKIIQELAQNDAFVEFLEFVAEAAAEAATALVEFVRVMIDEVEVAARRQGVALAEMGRFIGDLPFLLRKAVPGLENLGLTALAGARMFGDLAESLSDTAPEIEDIVPPAEAATEALEDLGTAAVETGESLESLLDTMANEAFKRLKEHEQQIVAIAGEYEELAVDVLPEVVEELGVVGDAAVEAGSQMIAAFRDAAETIRFILQDLVGDIAFLLVDSLLNGFEGFEEALGDIVGDAGAQIGAAAGERFGPIGEAVGEALGEAIGRGLGKAVASLFGGRDPVGEALAKFGLRISQELKDIIRQTAKDIGGDAEAAFRLHLVSVMEEMGIESAEALANFAHLTELILFDLERGFISAGQAVESLGGALGELIANFEEAGGTLSELNDIADIFTHTAQAVIDGLLSAADATEIINEHFADFLELALTMGDEGVAAIQRIVEHAELAGLSIEAIAQALGDAMDEAFDVLAQRSAFLIAESLDLVDAIEAMFAAGGVGPRQLEFAVTSVLQAFDAMVAAGLPLSQIMFNLENALGLIGEQAQGLGIELGEEFERLGEVFNILADDAIQNAITRLEALEGAVNAAGNMGLLTAGQFDLFGDRVRQTFNSLVAGGLTSEEALAALAPQLQELHDLSQQYGFAVDRNTQSLLDQALAQGVVQDQGLTTEDILIKGFDAMLQALNALIVALGGVPLIFDDWSDSIGRASNEVDELADELAALGNLGGGGVDIDISPPGFAHGSGGFQDFGSGTTRMLHGTEEVITQAQGVGVADMVRIALRDSGRGRDDRELVLAVRERVRQELHASSQRDSHRKATLSVAKEVKLGRQKPRPFATETAGTVC